MLLGVGVDVLHIPRLRAMLARRNPDQFARRILSLAEQEQYNGIDASRRVRFLAVSWALKEAAYKAFFPALKLSWKDATILRDRPKPALTLCSSLSKTGLIGPIHCSVSHDGEYVFATVIAERAESSGNNRFHS